MNPRSTGVMLLLGVLAGCDQPTSPRAGADPAPSAAAIEQVAPLPGLQLRPLTDRRFERSEERRARGKYLAEGILQCAICHSERDWSQPGAPPMAGKAYAGMVWRDDGDSRLVAANITPDPETGAGRWSDDMLARAIREGIGHDGRLLHPQMWYRSFRELSDEDLAAVIVYLRSLPPVRNSLPKTVLSDEQVKRHLDAPRPITAAVAAPPQDTPTARGRYLVALADCSGCHTYWEGPRMPGAYAGGNHIERGEHGGYSTNITPHETGMGYDAAGLIALMRTGKAGLTKPVMPWIAFRNLNDEDLAAIHAFLSTRHPVAHHISNLAAPSQCEVCGQQHGLGSLNRREPLSGITLPQALLESYVGTYRLEELDWTLRISLSHGVLLAHDADLPAKPLFALSDSRFVMEDGLGPLRFDRGPHGRIVSVTSEDTDDLVLKRITGVTAE